MKSVTFEKKFGNKLYKAVHVQWTTNGESDAKEKATSKAKKLRDGGFSARVEREVHTRYPPKGPEAFYVVYARKDGLTLEQVYIKSHKIFLGA